MSPAESFVSGTLLGECIGIMGRGMNEHPFVGRFAAGCDSDKVARHANV